MTDLVIIETNTRWLPMCRERLFDQAQGEVLVYRARVRKPKLAGDIHGPTGEMTQDWPLLGAPAILNMESPP